MFMKIINDEEIKKIIKEEAEKAIINDNEYFLRRNIDRLIREEIEGFGYRLKTVTNDNKSYISEYTAEKIGEELSAFLNEEQIKKIIAEVIIQEISQMPTYILRAITDILREQMNGISAGIHTNNTRVNELKRIVSEKFNTYIP